ncbi:MAG: hypothetical protein DRJ01_15355, partial [Bacteroidetes bacterium]
QMNKQLLILIFLAVFGITANSQDLIKPKLIKSKGDYIHKYSETVFPKLIDGKYLRKKIYAFDKKKKNIGVTYENQENIQKINFTIYIYPAGDGSEGRLRNEYLISMQSVAKMTNDGLEATQYPVKFEGSKYICNGFKSTFETRNKEYSQLSLYECGTWFFKLRLTSEIKDSVQISDLESKILNQFDPSHFTELKPLNPKAGVYFSKIAFQDSILLGSAMGSAFKKIEWAIENVSDKERASGFPDLYLEMHIESLKEFAAFAKKYDYKKTKYTEQYLKELNSIIDAGFLGEFIMEGFSMVVIPPENHVFNFDGFEMWKRKNNLTIDLNKLFYVVSYGQE